MKPLNSYPHSRFSLAALAAGLLVLTVVSSTAAVNLSGSQSSYTFQSGYRYYVQNSFTVGPGAAVFQSGSAIKFGNNAYLKTYGGVSFSTTGQVVFTSKDDNSPDAGEVITGSTGEPGYAAAQELWLYYPSSMSTVSNAVFRWAQRGLEWDEASGHGHGAVLSGCAFKNCSTGIYQNTPGDTLYLSGPPSLPAPNPTNTYCNVVTPILTVAGSVSGSLVNDCGTPTAYWPVNASLTNGVDGETAIAVNPANPANLFTAFNHCTGSSSCSIYGARSTDGGITWSTSAPLPGSSYLDPAVAFDTFGNLFVAYLPLDSSSVVLLLSTDGGSSFSTIHTFSDGGNFLDRPWIATGPGPSGSYTPSSVWITFLDFNRYVVAAGAVVTNLGSANIGPWSNLLVIPNTAYDGADFDPSAIAVGPNGEVAVVVEDTASSIPSELRVSVNTTGLIPPISFPPASTVWTSQVVFAQGIPAQPQRPLLGRGISATPGLAWDRTGGSYRGRLYMAYADRPAAQHDNTDIYAMYSVNNGTNWSSPLKINKDATSTSQFFPAIAVDETSGKVGVSWYDCRADTTNNRKTRFFAAVSADGGQTFPGSNIQLETGQSDTSLTNPNYHWDYSDFTRVAYYGGWFYPAWADNSSTGDTQMDIYVVRIRY